MQQRTPHIKNLDIYLVANEKALGLLNRAHIVINLRDTINGLFDINLKTIPLDLSKKYSPYLNSRHTYTTPYSPPPATARQHPYKKFQEAWQATNFIYTDGSQIMGNPTLGASIVVPRTKTTTRIEIKSQPERQTINRAELAAITTALDLYNHAPILFILTDSAFNINNLRSYT